MEPQQFFALQNNRYDVKAEKYEQQVETLHNEVIEAYKNGPPKDDKDGKMTHAQRMKQKRE